jgi:hypothetical protein
MPDRAGYPRIGVTVVRPEPTVKVPHKGDGYTVFSIEEARSLFRELGDALMQVEAFTQPRDGDHDSWSFDGRVVERQPGDLVVIKVETGDSLPMQGDSVTVKVTPMLKGTR